MLILGRAVDCFHSSVYDFLSFPSSVISPLCVISICPLTHPSLQHPPLVTENTTLSEEVSKAGQKYPESQLPHLDKYPKCQASPNRKNASSNFSTLLHTDKGRWLPFFSRSILVLFLGSFQQLVGKWSTSLFQTDLVVPHILKRPCIRIIKLPFFCKGKSKFESCRSFLYKVFFLNFLH